MMNMQTPIPQNPLTEELKTQALKDFREGKVAAVPHSVLRMLTDPNLSKDEWLTLTLLYQRYFETEGYKLLSAEVEILGERSWLATLLKKQHPPQ